MADELRHLFALLAAAIRESDPAALTEPVEVGALVTRWLPYARVGRVVGVATFEEYELLLMRLISGEGGFIFSDETLQDDLRRELGSAHPDRSVLDTYGAARLTLAREPLRQALGITDDALPLSAVARALRRPAPRGPSVPDPTASAPGALRRVLLTSCPFCGESIPDDREVHFCPSCGLNVRTIHCAGCSTELDAGWRFCVTCGRPAHPA
jgi:hypothetical protein